MISYTPLFLQFLNYSNVPTQGPTRSSIRYSNPSRQGLRPYPDRRYRYDRVSTKSIQRARFVKLKSQLDYRPGRKLRKGPPGIVGRRGERDATARVIRLEWGQCDE